MKIKIAYLVLLFAIINCHSSNAQFTDRYWAFGDSAAIDFKILANPQPASSILRVRGTCASICDSVGDLLFYCGSPNWSQWLAINNIFTDGTVVSKNHVVMESGDSLVGTLWYQEMVIVPDPANQNRFYIFSAGVTSATQGLYYSIIDLSFNGGLGKVVQKNVQLRTDRICDGITAVRHGNGRDWWVLARGWDFAPKNDITAYLISPSGVTANTPQYIGVPATGETFFRLKFNMDGNHLYNVAARGIVERFDFDRCNGIVSNQITYNNLGSPLQWCWSFEISPDE
ncbi:MAG: hypothetical protein ACKVQV_14890, partial [Bacteroidia bacterium]